MVKWRKQLVLKIIHKIKRPGQSSLPFIAYFLPHTSFPASTPLSNYGSLHHRLHNSVSLLLAPFPFVSVVLSLLCAINAACSQFVSVLLKLPRFTTWLGDLFEN